MRRLLLIVILVLSCAGAFAQSYSVFSIEGEVKVRNTNGSSWSDANKRDLLNTTSMVQIPESGSICLVEKPTNKIIEYDRPGEYMVRDIVTASQKKSNSIFASLNKKLAKDISKDNKKNGLSFVSGSTTRGGKSSPDFSDSLYAAIYNYINADTPYVVSDLAIRKRYLSKDEFYLEIENNSDNRYFVNVLALHGHEMAFAYRFSDLGYDQLPLDAGRKAILKDTVFAEGGDSLRYILIATPMPYKSSSVSHDLLRMDPPKYDTPLKDVVFSE